MEQDGPVTVVVRHRVKPGMGARFEEWLRGINKAATAFPGHSGFSVIRPAESGEPEYLVFLRFDTFAHLEAWEQSDERREWLERAVPLTVGPPKRVRHTGLEVWFTPPPGRRAPPRYKMAVVTLLAIYPLISLVQFALTPLLGSWPLFLRTLVSSALLVGLMTFAVMPLMTRAFSRWLYGPPPE